jgi:6-pyruvoyltetrahydropterin/6-carboxytetrahydropterin synthase
MAEPCWRLTVRSEFAASHCLRNFKGPCEALHGHNFAVEAQVEGRDLEPDTGILVDFGELKDALKQTLAPLDHAHLNEVEPFDRLNPSSEHLARYICQGLQRLLADKPVRVVAVTVSERAAQSATYCPEGA